MRIIQTYPKSNFGSAIFLIAIAILVAAIGLAQAHGGKHAGQFTHLQALQKGTQLYDQLIGRGKLDESWESKLVNVSISMRKVTSGEEIVVAFKRESGDPDTVYIFFNKS